MLLMAAGRVACFLVWVGHVCKDAATACTVAEVRLLMWYMLSF
jgi:hypothetical protein